MTWEYDKGHMRHKHDWNLDEAGFRKQGKKGLLVGKCPKNVTVGSAKTLLNAGERMVAPHEADRPDAVPEAIYNVLDGVPYVAVPTEIGKSFHAYPFHPHLDEMPERIRAKLERRVVKSGNLREWKRWWKSPPEPR